MAEEIESLALSQEELLAALVLTELPALPGFDNLAELVFTTLAEEGRMALLAAAGRSLVAHGCAYPVAQDLKIEETIGRILRVCAYPDQTWVILHQPAGQVQRATYIHHFDTQWVAHIETTGIHQWVRLGGRDEIAATAHQVLFPLTEMSGITITGEVAETVFSALVATAAQSSAVELQKRLQQSGLSLDTAQAFAETLATQRSITAFARFDQVAQPALQTAFTVVVSNQAQWLLQMNKPGVLSIKQVPPSTIIQALTNLVSA